MKGISVIICCFNSGKKIIPTLNHLSKQQANSNMLVEIILVDNNSTDNTQILATEEWGKLGNPFKLTIVKQPIPGLKNAKEMGIRSALYDYIIFCDDDNWLCDTYVNRVYQLFENYKKVAILGGVGDAVCEITPPVWFNLLDGFGYAIGKEGRKNGFVDFAYGAGMAIRKSVVMELVNSGEGFILDGRTGKNLSSGEDIELCFLVREAGYNILFDDQLLFQHFLTKNRLTWSYYLKLRSSFGRANAYIQLYTLDHSILEKVVNRNRFKQSISLILYLFSNIKFLLFSEFFQNRTCANFFQNWSFLKTRYFERNVLLKLAKIRNLNLYNKSNF